VDANLAPIVVGAAAQFGAEALQQQYLAIYQQRRVLGASPQQIGRYVSSFYRFQQPVMVERTFHWIDEGIFPLQEILLIISSMMNQWSTRKASWEWIKSHWALFDGSGGDAIPVVTPRIVQATGSLPGELRQEVGAFYAEHLHGELRASVAQALEQMAQSEEVEARTRGDLIAWFSRQRR
jgi:aminopeptidase N